MLTNAPIYGLAQFASYLPMYQTTPLAFVRGDFSFLCCGELHNRVCLPLPTSVMHSRRCNHCLEFAWRHDTSAHNFKKQRFLLHSHPIFLPVDAGVSYYPSRELEGSFLLRTPSACGVHYRQPLFLTVSSGTVMCRGSCAKLVCTPIPTLINSV